MNPLPYHLLIYVNILHTHAITYHVCVFVVVVFNYSKQKIILKIVLMMSLRLRSDKHQCFLCTTMQAKSFAEDGNPKQAMKHFNSALQCRSLLYFSSIFVITIIMSLFIIGLVILLSLLL